MVNYQKLYTMLFNAASDALDALEFPVYAKGVTPQGPWKIGSGEINVPIACCGQVVFPGETLYLDVVGDEISWRRPPEGLIGTCLVFIGRKLDEKSLQDGLRALVLPA